MLVFEGTPNVTFVPLLLIVILLKVTEGTDAAIAIVLPELKITASPVVGPATLVLGVQFDGVTHEPLVPPFQV